VLTKRAPGGAVAGTASAGNGADPTRAALTVSAVVVNYRQPALLEACLRSLEPALERVGVGSELVVVDNGSGDESCELVRSRFASARLVSLPENLGFPAAVNHGMRHSSGGWILLLNNDTTLEPQAVEAMLAAARGSDRVGSVAAQMRFAEHPGVINSAGIEVDRLGASAERFVGRPVEDSEREPVEVFGAHGGAGLFRREMLEEIGGFDDSFFFALDDVDVAWRARMRGWRCVYAPRAVVYHHNAATVRHRTPIKYYQVGLNRLRVLAKNATGAQLRRHGLAILGYELAYVAFACVNDRTLAPLRGRLRGLREWRRYRRAGAPGRRPIDLDPPAGLRAALARRSAWSSLSSAHRDGRPDEPAAVADGSTGTSLPR
jgi:GT2 family glycosyltransferase